MHPRIRISRLSLFFSIWCCCCCWRSFFVYYPIPSHANWCVKTWRKILKISKYIASQQLKLLCHTDFDLTRLENKLKSQMKVEVEEKKKKKQRWRTSRGAFILYTIYIYIYIYIRIRTNPDSSQAILINFWRVSPFSAQGIERNFVCWRVSWRRLSTLLSLLLLLSSLLITDPFSLLLLEKGRRSKKKCFSSFSSAS
jgi:hypothetical protein